MFFELKKFTLRCWLFHTKLKKQMFKLLHWRIYQLTGFTHAFIFFLKSPLDIDRIMSATGECRKHLVKGHGHD